MTSTIPDGLKLNNPGNIERDGDRVRYDGEVVPSSHPVLKQFVAPGWGLRAILVCLQAYIEKDGVKTLGDAVARWAPPSENDTTAYQAAVCADCAAVIDTPFTVGWLRLHASAMVNSITQREVSYQYSTTLVDLAINLTWEET